MKLSRATKISLRIALFVVLAVVALWLSAILWSGYETHFASRNVRAPLRAVYHAYWVSKVTGGYWEDELQKQAKFVAQLSQPERVEFYRSILLECDDIEGGRAIIFTEAIGGDAHALAFDLRRLQQSPQFLKLDATQRKRVSDWCDELEIIAKSEKK